MGFIINKVFNVWKPRTSMPTNRFFPLLSQDQEWMKLLSRERKLHKLSYLQKPRTTMLYPIITTSQVHYLLSFSKKMCYSWEEKELVSSLLSEWFFRDQQCHASRQRWHPDKCSNWLKWRTGQTLFQSYLHTYFILRPAFNTLKPTPHSSVFVISTYLSRDQDN